MSFSLRGLGRAGLWAIVALQGAAFALVTGEARATWHCGVVDGIDSTNTGHTGSTVHGATGALNFNGWAVPLYTRLNSAGQSVGRVGYDTSFSSMTCNNTDPFLVGDVDGIAGENGASGLVDGSMVWTAFTNSAGDLFAGGSSLGVVAGAKIFDSAASGGTKIIGTPSLAIFGGDTFIFYTAQFSDGHIEVRKNVWDASLASWGGDAHFDGSLGDNRRDPSVVVLDGALWVFYWDSTVNGVVAKFSADGVNWTLSDVNSTGLIDGAGGPGGQHNEDMGRFLSAIVDTNATPNRVHVFYWDFGSTPHSLRESFKDSATAWQATKVEDVTIAAPAAPVLHGGTVQAYYVDSANLVLRGASKSGSSWSAAIIDGGSSNLCGTNGGTSHQVWGPVAVVERAPCVLMGAQTGPHVFYADFTTGHRNLREAFWF